MTYQEFLNKKAIIDVPSGFEPGPLNQSLFDFQKDVVSWAIRRGRAALFEDCGLGKTIQQLEWAWQVSRKTQKPVLILAPLAVAAQTKKEGEHFGYGVKICESQADATDAINITNYEKLHKFDPSAFSGIVLDESSILKSYDGKFRNLIIDSFAHTPYRLACTATPAPNDFMELGNHAEFLGVMTRTQMLSTFFVHDGGDTSKWRIKGHAEADFWRWICSWAVNIRKPSDLGYPDGDFILPELKMHWHTVEANHQTAGLIFSLPASTLQERRDARRASLEPRVALAAQIANSTDEQCLIWCDLNSESESLARIINGAIEVTGSDSDEHKANSMIDFANGSIRALVSKPSICGFGMNFQRCHKMIFVGLSDSYERIYQAIRRCWRFGQKHPVEAHFVTSNLEGAVLTNIKRKEVDADRMANEMVKHMAEISTATIRGTERQTLKYNPTIQIQIPQWLKEVA
jgi:superfamily II DNA or RNA helicase